MVVGHCGFGCDHGRTLSLPIAVAQPTMVLPAGVDHLFHRLICHGVHRCVQRLGALPGSPRINKHGTSLGHDQPEGRVVGVVFRVALLIGADNGPDILGNGVDYQTLRKSKSGKRECSGENKWAHHADSHPSSLATSGRPPACTRLLSTEKPSVDITPAMVMAAMPVTFSISTLTVFISVSSWLALYTINAHVQIQKTRLWRFILELVSGVN